VKKALSFTTQKRTFTMQALQTLPFFAEYCYNITKFSFNNLYAVSVQNMSIKHIMARRNNAAR